MRCDNCGWNNPDGLTKCQKCNQELKQAPAPVQNNFNQTVLDPSRNRSEVQEGSQVFCPGCGYPLSEGVTVCPNCGTAASVAEPAPSQYSKTVRVLPENLLSEEKPKQEALKATVREIPQHLLDNTKTVRVLPEELLQDEAPVQQAAPQPMPVQPEPVPAPAPVPAFRLVPMDNFDGLTPAALSFSGEAVSLGRKDVVAGDASIAEDVHAAFEFADGQWSVSDKSGKASTYVCTSRKIQLQPGDIVVIGNRRYIFE